MHRIMLASKIHRAVVREGNLQYEGSITIDETILAPADVLPYQQGQGYNVSTGTRFETYTLAGEAGSGTIVVNGAAARLAHPGDRLIIAAYGMVEEARGGGGKARDGPLHGQNRIAA